MGCRSSPAWARLTWTLPWRCARHRPACLPPCVFRMRVTPPRRPCVCPPSVPGRGGARAADGPARHHRRGVQRVCRTRHQHLVHDRQVRLVVGCWLRDRRRGSTLQAPHPTAQPRGQGARRDHGNWRGRDPRPRGWCGVPLVCFGRASLPPCAPAPPAVLARAAQTLAKIAAVTGIQEVTTFSEKRAA